MNLNFFERIHGKEKINFRVLGVNARNLYGTYEELENELLYYNEKGYDIHFVVNEGCTKGHEIDKITAVFIDIDCGKDKNGKYFELSKVEVLKKYYLDKIRKFMYKPSFIIDTRNGYHVYWLVKEGTELEDFLKAQLRLIKYFNSDEAVKTFEHTIRVPGFFWVKDKQNKYMCDIIEEHDVRYDLKDILSVLPECKEGNNITGRVARFVSGNIEHSHYSEDNIELIKNKNILGLRKVLFGVEIERKVTAIYDRYKEYRLFR